jgi:hypothetical protein
LCSSLGITNRPAESIRVIVFITHKIPQKMVFSKSDAKNRCHQTLNCGFKPSK